MPFEFGSDKNGDVLHYVDFDWNMNQQDAYIMKDPNGSILGITKKSDGTISKQYEEYSEVQYAFSNLLGYGEATLYGTEGLLEGLLGYAQRNVNQDAKFGAKEGSMNSRLAILHLWIPMNSIWLEPPSPLARKMSFSPSMQKFLPTIPAVSWWMTNFKRFNY